MVHWTGNRQSLFTNLCKTSTITTKYLHLTLNSLAYCLKCPVTFIIHIFKTLPLWFIIYNWKCDGCVHFIGLAYINWFLVKFVSWCDNHQFDNILQNEEEINTCVLIWIFINLKRIYFKMTVWNIFYAAVIRCQFVDGRISFHRMQT